MAAPTGIIAYAYLTTIFATPQVFGLNTSAVAQSVDFATYVAATGVGIASETDNINTPGGNVKLSDADAGSVNAMLAGPTPPSTRC